MRDGKVLIVEDDDDLRDLVRTVVEREGMATIEAADGREGLRQFYEHRPSLLILDIGLPELDGWQVLERVRELGDVPVLILTAASDELDKVRGLRQGADDYVTKPFGRQELLARIHVLLRRSVERSGSDAAYADASLEVDFANRVVAVDGEERRLTPLEFRLLTTFVRHANQVLSREQLLDLVWGDSRGVSLDQVKLYVGYLRRKLGGRVEIETVRGFGYRLRAAGQSRSA